MTDICKEYAVALFELAGEKGGRGELMDALSFIEGIFDVTPGLSGFLRSPAIPLSRRTDTVKEAFGDSVPETAVNFLCLLCEKGQTDLFRVAVGEYAKLYEESVRRSRAVVTSAVELTDAEKERLAEALTKKSGTDRVDVEYVIDPDIIGGIIVETGGEVMDGSVRGRLNSIKKGLENE